MKKIWLIAFGIWCITTSQVYGIQSNTTGLGPNKKQTLSAQSFVQLSPAEFELSQNKHLTWKEKLVFKYTKRQVKKLMAKGDQVENATDLYYRNNGRFNLGGFLLGFFLGLIGVLIAILFGGNAVRSALIGCLCLVIVALIWWLL